MGQATQNFNLTRGDGGHGLWQTPGSGLTIEYSFEVLERIRNWTLEAYRALARGGIEVGGVLFGRHEGRLVRVLDVRPIACEHAYGPAFVLSERDEKALTALLAEAPQDAELAGLEPVGWYVSHTRSGLSLSERDLDLHARFFPEWWQIALVARQAEEGAISAGFFVPARNGSMGAEPAGGPFEVRPFRPGAASPVVSGSRVVEAELPADSQPELQPEPQPRQSSAPPLPAKQPSIEAAEPELVPRFEPDPPPQRLAVSEPVRHERAPFGAQFGRSDEPEPNKAERGWLWWIPFGLALFVGGVAAGPMMLERAPAPLPAAPAKAVSLGLQLHDRNGQLDVAWDRASAPVLNAGRGVLEIEERGSDGDAGKKSSLALTPEAVQRGTATYAREGGRVDFRLTVWPQNGEPVSEYASFVGPPPGPAMPQSLASDRELKQASREMQQASRERDRAVEEAAKLRRANQAQATRISQLEQAVVVLRRRAATEESLRRRPR